MGGGRIIATGLAARLVRTHKSRPPAYLHLDSDTSRSSNDTRTVFSPRVSVTVELSMICRIRCTLRVLYLSQKTLTSCHMSLLRDSPETCFLQHRTGRRQLQNTRKHHTRGHVLCFKVQSSYSSLLPPRMRL